MRKNQLLETPEEANRRACDLLECWSEGGEGQRLNLDGSSWLTISLQAVNSTKQMNDF